MPDVLAKDLLWPSLSIYLCFQLSFTAVNSLAMFLLTWPPWHPSPSQHLSSAHNLASRIGRSMRSVSSWRSKEPWNTCQASFVDHFFFNNVGVVWRSPSFASVLEPLRGFWRVVPVSQDDGIQRMSAIGTYLRWRFVEDLEGLYGTAKVCYYSQIVRYIAWYRAKCSTLQIC